MPTKHMSFFVTGSHMKMKIYFAVLFCDSSCQGNNFISSLKVNRVELFFYRVKNTGSKVIKCS